MKLTPYKALIRSVITYACSTWKYAADANLLKLQRLQNRVLRPIGKLEKSTKVREMHMAFKIPYVYDYVTKLWRTQAEVILNHRNPIVCVIGQGSPMHRKYKKLNLGCGQAYDRSVN
jgi:hypothetical protein